VAYISKESELNLELKGTVGGTGKTSYEVIIDRDSSIENVYSLGDFITGARVTEVLNSKVVLDVNGERQALMLEQDNSPAEQVGSIKRAQRQVVLPRRATALPLPILFF
jgi:hypothetical protein